MKALRRDSRIVDLTPRRAAAASATSSFSCSWSSRNASSVLASAGAHLPVRCDSFIGTSTSWLRRKSANLAAEPSIFSTTREAPSGSAWARAGSRSLARSSSTFSLRSRSSTRVSASSGRSTSNWGSTSIRMVWSISFISDDGVTLSSRLKRA